MSLGKWIIKSTKTIIIGPLLLLSMLAILYYVDLPI